MIADQRLIEKLCEYLDDYAEQDEGNGHNKAAAGTRKLVAEVRTALTVETAIPTEQFNELAAAYGLAAGRERADALRWFMLGRCSRVETNDDEGWREHPDGRITVADITLRPDPPLREGTEDAWGYLAEARRYIECDPIAEERGVIERFDAAVNELRRAVKTKGEPHVTERVEGCTCEGCYDLDESQSSDTRTTPP